MAACTLGHSPANRNAMGNMTKNPMITTKLEPENMPSHSGSSVSKYLLWINTTIPDMINAPSIPVSRVFMPQIMVRPLVPPISAPKSTPNPVPQKSSTAERKYWNVT